MSTKTEEVIEIINDQTARLLQIARSLEGEFSKAALDITEVTGWLLTAGNKLRTDAAEKTVQSPEISTRVCDGLTMPGWKDDR